MRSPSPSALPPCVASSWFAELRLAESASEVIALTRQFVARLSPREILRLPHHCRPGRLAAAKEIHELAFELERAQSDSMGRLVDALVLDRMASYFQEAVNALERVCGQRGAFAR